MDAALPPLTAGHALPRRHAHWQPRGHHAARAARVARVRRRRRRGHAPLRAIAEAFRNLQTALELFPVQRGQAQRGNHRTPPARRESRAGHGRRQSRHQRSGRTRGQSGHRRRFPRRIRAGRRAHWSRRSPRAACRRTNFISSVFCRTNPASGGTSWNRSRVSMARWCFTNRRIGSKNCWAN